MMTSVPLSARSTTANGTLACSLCQLIHEHGALLHDMKAHRQYHVTEANDFNLIGLGHVWENRKDTYFALLFPELIEMMEDYVYGMRAHHWTATAFLDVRIKHAEDHALLNPLRSSPAMLVVSNLNSMSPVEQQLTIPRELPQTTSEEWQEAIESMRDFMRVPLPDDHWTKWPWAEQALKK